MRPTDDASRRYVHVPVVDRLKLAETGQTMVASLRVTIAQVYRTSVEAS